MMSETKRMQLYLTEKLKKDLSDMSEDLGMTQNNLGILAIQSLVTNYKEKGTKIFVDLIDTKNKGSE